MSADKDFFEVVGTQSHPVGNRYIPPPPQPSQSTPPNTGEGTSWACAGDNFWRIGKSHTTLPTGVYRCDQSMQMGPFFAKVKNDTDQLIVFPDSTSEALLKEISDFQGMKAKFTSLGFLHKRGILMWGPPGSGKTTTLQLLIQMMTTKHGGIAVFIDNPLLAVSCLQMLRAVEPDRQIIGIMEDLDALVDRFGEAPFLSMLDGENQVDNVVYVATTNYPERLDSRFVDRPSRFDTVRYIGMPNDEARAAYFKAKVSHLSDKVRQSFVDATDGFSVAHLRELIILTQCFDVSLDDAIARLNKTRKVKPNSTKAPDRPDTGFSNLKNVASKK